MTVTASAQRLDERLDAWWRARAGRPLGLDVAALVLVLAGIFLSVVGIVTAVDDDASVGTTIILTDHYAFTGGPHGWALAALGLAQLVAFVGALRVRWVGFVEIVAAATVALAAYGFAQTGQWAGLLASVAVLLLVEWSRRALASQRQPVEAGGS